MCRLMHFIFVPRDSSLMRVGGWGEGGVRRRSSGCHSASLSPTVTVRRGLVRRGGACGCRRPEKPFGCSKNVWWVGL